MKKSTLLAFAALLITVNSCRKNDPSEKLSLSTPDPTQLDLLIHDKFLSEGEFRWEWASDEQIWTALSNSDYVLSVGYQPAGQQNVADRLHVLDVQAPEWRAARQTVLNLILDAERELDPGVTEASLIQFEENPRLPVFCVSVHNPATISILRANNLVRYAEPIGYEPYMTRAADRSGSGCDSNGPESGLVPGTDYQNIAPDSKQSWNHAFHKINEAWNNSTGSGCKVTIIDTGANNEQENLGNDFNQGFSNGRSLTRLVTMPPPPGGSESPDDQCGHGTSMLGACAAPRGEDGAASGVAYNCDLVSIRAAEDVYLNASREVTGVSNAFTQAGDSDTKIISMSMGRVTSSNQIRDAVKYAYGKGKLIFAAAGTSFWWSSWFVGVIFPASMAECSAVTGIKSNLTSACGDCHTGSKVDFVLVMERNSDGLVPLSLADAGDEPSTVGGSSVATASTAGIAALIWAKWPTWTRAQVFDKMKQNGNYWPNKHGSFGWGRINAQNATQ